MRKTLLYLSLFVFGAFGVAAVQAQAPAGAPAGATGICKDGTYSMQAKKTGACRGHKGVQTWYASAGSESITPTPPRPHTAAKPEAPMSAPQSQPAVPPTAAPKPEPRSPEAPAAPAHGMRLSPEQSAAQRPVAPGGGPGMVWANEESKVYHCVGDPFYGRTKKGMYMTESDAQAKGFHGSRGKTCK